MHPYLMKSASELARLIRDGETSSEALMIGEATLNQNDLTQSQDPPPKESARMLDVTIVFVMF